MIDFKELPQDGRAFEQFVREMLYFDDKHEDFRVFADYLVPHNQEPSLAPKDFNSILDDGMGLHNDGEAMWYITDWDIQLKRIFPHSNHFHLDHYDYYNPQDGNFQIGIPRGDTVGELCRYGNSWR